MRVYTLDPLTAEQIAAILRQQEAGLKVLDGKTTGDEKGRRKGTEGTEGTKGTEGRDWNF